MTTTSLLPDSGVELREGYADVGDHCLRHIGAHSPSGLPTSVDAIVTLILPKLVHRRAQPRKEETR